MNHPSTHMEQQNISDMLLALSQNFSSSEVTIRELRDGLSGCVYGILLLLFALPNLVPLPMLGLSAVTGVPLLLLSVQMLFKKTTPWFPEGVLNRSLKTEHLHKLCTVAVPYLRRIESVGKPRCLFLFRHPMHKIIAIMCALLSLILMLPVPFGNMLPALSICLFSIAMLQRDGVLVVLGMICTIVSCVLIVGIVTAMIMAVLHFWGMGYVTPL